jgi:hypothetical protein
MISGPDGAELKTAFIIFLMSPSFACAILFPK